LQSFIALAFKLLKLFQILKNRYFSNLSKGNYKIDVVSIIKYNLQSFMSKALTLRKIPWNKPKVFQPRPIISIGALGYCRRKGMVFKLDKVHIFHEDCESFRSLAFKLSSTETITRKYLLCKVANLFMIGYKPLTK